MENCKNGTVAEEEQYSWLLLKYNNILVENKDCELKIQEMGERIELLRKEQRKMLNRQAKIANASYLLELLCKAFQSANKKMREGGVSQVNSEWEELRTAAENPDDTRINNLIERMKINIETVGSEELSGSQQGSCCDKKKQLLAAEMDLAVQFSPYLLVLEDDLINQNKLLHLEHTQLEEKVKRTLAWFARVKLDLSKFKYEWRQLQNNLQKCSRVLCSLWKSDLEKMTSDFREMKKKNSATSFQWQVNHNMLCEILDDVRMFNVEDVKENEKIWQVCNTCKQFNSERMELIHQLLEKTAQGYH